MLRVSASFAALRVNPGRLYGDGFTLTLTYLAERCTITAVGGAMAAYITGNVASNLVGRLLGTGIADVWGLSVSFWAFAGLNLVGALIARPGSSRGLRAKDMRDLPV